MLSRTMTLAALCIITSALVQHCGLDVIFPLQYELEGCPDSAFSLPLTVENGPYRLERAPDDPQGCPAFTPYRLFEKTRRRPGAWVRLDRRTPCSLVVATSYQTAGPIISFVGAGKPSEREERRARPLMDVIARLVMQGSTAIPRFPGVRLEGFDETFERKMCAKTADSTDGVGSASPEFHSFARPAIILRSARGRTRTCTGIAP
jgi:hypothetical protein